MGEIRVREVPRRYHHGDLRAALLEAAEEIIERDGVQALTLRAAARAVGVSHAAPANHFGDLTGLLSELAAIGYRRFAHALQAAKSSAEGSGERGAPAMGRAYVNFARQQAGMFALMFRSERLDMSRPSLRAAIDEARQALRDAASMRPKDAAPPSPLARAAEAVALWSLVHGFATLLLDGRLDGILSALPAGDDVDTLLAAILAPRHR
ncbi:MAG TPA: TetR-like C-terminal domain-containing protein [Acetobacteraceae bacterium]|nr:TetR-like C-terminal domain-containing protein [Acetobacteraceae bacterium]